VADVYDTLMHEILRSVNTPELADPETGRLLPRWLILLPDGTAPGLADVADVPRMERRSAAMTQTEEAAYRAAQPRAHAALTSEGRLRKPAPETPAKRAKIRATLEEEASRPMDPFGLGSPVTSHDSSVTNEASAREPGSRY
jgi:hypothetical protein